MQKGFGFRSSLGAGLAVLMLAMPARAGQQATTCFKADGKEVEATLTLREPVGELRFDPRTGNGARLQGWLLPAGMQWQGTALSRQDGHPFTEVTVRVRALGQHLDRENDGLVPFTHGPLAVLTGQFNVAEADNRFCVSNAETGLVLYDGEPLRTGVTRPIDGNGGYVVLRAVAATRLPQGYALLDPALPLWMVDELKDFLPKVVAYYQRKTGVPPAVKPFVLFNRQPARPRSLLGEVLAHSVHYELAGEDSGSQSPARRRYVRQLFAHEAAHFWNHSLSQGGLLEAWLTEGAADAWADQALHDLGYDSDAQWLAAQSEHLSGCSSALGDRPFLNQPGRVPYDCGAAAQLLAEAAVAGKQGQADAFTLWRPLLKPASSGMANLSEAYFLVLDRESGSSKASTVIRRWRDQGLDGESLETAFAELKRPLKMRDPDNADEYRAQYTRFLSDLMQGDCAGEASFFWADGEVQLKTLPQCKTLRRNLDVVGFADRTLWQPSAPVIEKMLTLCREKGAVPLWVKGREQREWLPCPQGLRAPEPIYSFAGLP